DEITSHGLSAGQPCYYAVADTDGLVAGGDDASRFTTSPTGVRPMRVWVVGNSGTGDKKAKAVRDGFASYSAGRPADLWLMLGNNAYDKGTDSQYETALFDMYASQLMSVP